MDRSVLLEAAAVYGTPLFIYDGDLMLRRYHELYEFIRYDKLRIFYAMKANYNLALLRMLRDAGASLDTVSPGEVHYALAAGYTPDRILFTANNLTEAESDEVAALGVLMNIGSLSHLEKFARKHPGSRVCLRFNPDVRDGDSEKTMTAGDLTKFGIMLSDVDRAVALVRQHGLHVVGLHEHTGSGLQLAESVYQSMKNLMAIATPDRFPELEFLDFGGGFKVPYKPDEKRIDYVAMGQEIVRLFREFNVRYGRELAMYFEPGKYIAAEAGTLLVEVNTVKHNRTRTIVGCNSGFPQLIRPVLYDAYHQIENLSRPEAPSEVVDVCGNICETGDRFAEQRALPHVEEGDILAIRNAGAYCYSMGGVYNLRPMPAEVVVRNGRITLARRGLTSRELAQQIIQESC